MPGVPVEASRGGSQTTSLMGFQRSNWLNSEKIMAEWGTMRHVEGLRLALSLMPFTPNELVTLPWKQLSCKAHINLRGCLIPSLHHYSQALWCSQFRHLGFSRTNISKQIRCYFSHLDLLTTFSDPVTTCRTVSTSTFQLEIFKLTMMSIDMLESRE